MKLLVLIEGVVLLLALQPLQILLLSDVEGPVSLYMVIALLHLLSLFSHLLTSDTEAGLDLATASHPPAGKPLGGAGLVASLPSWPNYFPN